MRCVDEAAGWARHRSGSDQGQHYLKSLEGLVGQVSTVRIYSVQILGVNACTSNSYEGCPIQPNTCTRRHGGLTICLWLGPPWFNYWFSFTLAYSRIGHKYSSLFIIVINLIFVFSLQCID